MPVSSASPDESATVDCVEAQCLMQWVPRIATPPLVDRRVARQPAKSVSTFRLKRCVGCCHLKRYTNLGFPFKYLMVLLSRCKLLCVGAAKSLQSSFAAKAISGRSCAR